MLTTWDQRMRRDKIKVTRIQFPVPTTQDDLYQRLREGDHAADEGPAFLPHHQPDRPAVSGAAIWPHGALARHPDDRRRRARARAFPVQAARSRMRLLRRQPAQVAARADRQRVALRAQGEHREDLAAAGRAGAADDTTSASSRRSARIRRRLRAAIAEALAFHQAIGTERKAARLRYLTLRWANALKSHPRVKMLSSLEPGQTWGVAMVGIDGIDARALSQLMMDRYRIVVNAVVGGSRRSRCSTIRACA